MKVLLRPESFDDREVFFSHRPIGPGWRELGGTVGRTLKSQPCPCHASSCL